MKNGQCPKCGATPVYFLAGGPGGAPTNTVRLSRWAVNGFAAVDTYACVVCGYVESYIADPERCSFIADHWTAVAGTEARGAQPGPDTPTRRLPTLPPDLR